MRRVRCVKNEADDSRGGGDNDGVREALVALDDIDT